MLRGRVDSWLGGLLVCSLAGGCDFAFRLDHVASDGAHPDGHAPIPPPADCPTPILIDDFTIVSQGAAVCMPWGSGYVDPNATAVEGGALVLTPSPQGASVAGCTSNLEYRFGTGLMAIVDSVVLGPDVYTVLQVHGVLEYQLKVGGDGLLHFQTSASEDIGAVTYQPAMRWWRIRPSPPSTLIGEYSTDGQTWLPVGTVPVASLPTTVGIELTGGTNTAGASGHAVFGQLLICPSTK